MKKLLLICMIFAIACTKCLGIYALPPSFDKFYASEVECLKTLEEIKPKCFQSCSLTLFIACEGTDYTALGKSFDANFYRFNTRAQNECYIKKNYNNISEVLIMDENNARDFFWGFGQLSFVKSFEIYFVSDKNETCVKAMENMKPVIEENVRPYYQFARVGMLNYKVPQLRGESQILILPRKFYPKHMCKKPSPLRQMTIYERTVI